jgi:hypothetical protein
MLRQIVQLQLGAPAQKGWRSLPRQRHTLLADASSRGAHAESARALSRIFQSLGYAHAELGDAVGALRSLVRASKCLPRSRTVLDDVQRVWQRWVAPVAAQGDAAAAAALRISPEAFVVLREDSAGALAALYAIHAGSNVPTLRPRKQGPGRPKRRRTR